MTVSPGTIVCAAANTGAVCRAAPTTNHTPATEATISRMPRKNRASPHGARRGARAGAAAVMHPIVAQRRATTRRRYPQPAGGPARPPGRRGHNGDMPETPTSDVRLLALAQVGEILGVSVDEVMALVTEGRLRGRARRLAGALAHRGGERRRLPRRPGRRGAPHGAVAPVEHRELPRAVGHRRGAQRRTDGRPRAPRSPRQTTPARPRGSTRRPRTARCDAR